MNPCAIGKCIAAIKLDAVRDADPGVAIKLRGAANHPGNKIDGSNFRSIRRRVFQFVMRDESIRYGFGQTIDCRPFPLNLSNNELFFDRGEFFFGSGDGATQLAKLSLLIMSAYSMIAEIFCPAVSSRFTCSRLSSSH